MTHTICQVKSEIRKGIIADPDVWKEYLRTRASERRSRLTIEGWTSKPFAQFVAVRVKWSMEPKKNDAVTLALYRDLLPAYTSIRQAYLRQRFCV